MFLVKEGLAVRELVREVGPIKYDARHDDSGGGGGDIRARTKGEKSEILRKPVCTGRKWKTREAVTLLRRINWGNM